MPRRAEFVVLALDIGSSSTRAALFDNRGRIVPGSSTRAEYAIHYTPDGGAELLPDKLLAAVSRGVRDTRRNPHAPLRAISGCGFWHSLLGLDRAGKPTAPILMWADSRSAADAAQLREEVGERDIQLRTGCMLRAPFWPAKLRWLRRTQPTLFKRTRRWVSPAQWLFGELFGARAVSHSMASGTGLYNLARRSWDDELCALCGIDAEQLGPISDIDSVAGIEVFTAIGDGAASNLGSGADRGATIAINVGTSAAVRAVELKEHEQLPLGLFRYAIDANRFLIGGATSNAGNLRQWCMRELGVRSAEQMEKALSRTAAAGDGLTILPFWTAERSPTWPDALSGAVIGLTQTTKRDQLVRAVMTSAFYRLADIFDMLEQMNGRADEVIVSGGVRDSPASLALLADALGRDIRLSAEPESSLRGAAVYALENVGASVAPLRRGELIRHKTPLTVQHRARRTRQHELERLLAR